ncbi:hypothetical protein O1L60_36970 [Streptomyces diastatochromogenes]|nr:hypothetical protein [Streptomyces diastatochromogenes]
MALTEGRPQIGVALLDGPVAQENTELATENMRGLPGLRRYESSRAVGAASRHGTFIAGILAARRGRAAPAICPNCTFLIRPVFTDATGRTGAFWAPRSTSWPPPSWKASTRARASSI